MKHIFIITILTISMVVLTACGHEHTWSEATCTTPKTCIECNKIDGEPLWHVWVDADCETAKTCSVCKEIQGEPLGHTWIEANCETAITCSICNITDGNALGHTWIDATYTAPKTCSICNQTEGEPLPKSVIKKIDGKVYFTKEVQDTVLAKLDKAGVPAGYTNVVIEDYYELMEGQEITELNTEALDNIINSLDKQLEAQEQAQKAQQEEKKQQQQQQQQNTGNSGNSGGNSGNSNGNSNEAPSDWETPEKESESNEPWVEAGISKEEYEEIVRQIQEEQAKTDKTGGDIVTDYNVNP